MNLRDKVLALAVRPAIVAAGAVIAMRVLTLASRFLLSLLLARMLTAAEVGQYGLVTGVLAFGLLAVGLEFYSFTMREMVPASGEERTRIVANQIFLAVPALGVVALAVVVAVFSGALSVTLAAWFVALLAVEHLSSEATRILIIMSRPIRAYICVFFRGGVWVFAIAVLMVADTSARSLATVFSFWIVGGMLSIAIAALALRELPWNDFHRYRPNWNWIVRGLRTARPFLLTSLAALILSYADRFVIDAFVGRDALGIYTFFSTIIIGILSLGSSIAHQFLPKVIAARSSGVVVFRAVLRQLFIVLSLVSGGVVILAAAGMPMVLSWLGMSLYAAHLSIFYIMLPGALIRIIADVPSYALYASHADIKLLAGNLVAAVVAIVANLALIPSVGLIGAAWASLLASAILSSLLGILAYRNLNKLPAAMATPQTDALTKPEA